MRNPFRSSPSTDQRVVYQVASWCLSYPDHTLLERVPLMRAALAEQGESATLLRFVEHLAETDLVSLRHEYVEVFDFSREHTLYLSYWTHGDTRRRGAALAGFKQLYRDSGFLVDTHGELPDHLPMVLEFAARVDLHEGAKVLAENRAALESIRTALSRSASAYADILAAVCATLPGEAHTLPPRPAPELVGLEPYDPRLLPLAVEPRITR